MSRLEADTPFVLGRASEISRDELKFSRFIDRIRLRFSDLFYQIMEKQLILKNVIHTSEWPKLRDTMRFNYAIDNHFAELKEQELIQDRLNMMRDAEDLVGRYYSKQYVKDHILRLTPDEQDRIEKEIKKEKEEEENYGEPLGPSNMAPQAPAPQNVVTTPGQPQEPEPAPTGDIGQRVSQGMAQSQQDQVKPEYISGSKVYNLNKRKYAGE